MIDISVELDGVKTAAGGSAVCQYICDALTKLQKGGYSMVNIDEELAIIQHNIYGKDIRMAIYNALYKLSMSEASGGDSPIVIGEPVNRLSTTDLISKNINGSMEWKEQITYP